MSAVAPAHDGRSRAIHVTQNEDWQRLVEHIEQYLTPAGRSAMEVELGRALHESIRTGSDDPVNACVEAWMRTIYLKSRGIEEDLDREDPDEEPRSLDDWRKQLSM